MHVYGVGNNSCGQLGQGDQDISDDGYVVVVGCNQDSKKRMGYVAAGWAYSAILSEDGNVFTCGLNTHNQLGQANRNKIFTPTLISALTHVFIHQIAFGERHLVLLSDEGRVYTCGSNYYRQLGHSDGDDCTVPTIVPEDFLPVPIQQIAAGCHHTVVLSVENEVYTFGGGNYGQLGHGDYSNSTMPGKVNGLPFQTAVAIAAGYFHTAILTDSGDVYAFGDNNRGQIGLDCSKASTRIPTKFSGIRNLDIVQIAAGGESTAFISSSGALYMCGNNRYGQLGFADVEKVRSPRLVSVLQEENTFVKHVSCTYDRTLILSDSGELFVMGRGFWGKREDLHSPTIVPGTENLHVIQMAAGDHHLLVLAEEKTVLYEADMVALLSKQIFTDLRVII